MSTFIVRVQLTVETSRNYTILRDGLINLGFTKRVTDSQGIEWRLPNGNYRIETNSDKDAVILAVQKVAFQIDKTPMIVVVKAEQKGMAWSGLQRC